MSELVLVVEDHADFRVLLTHAVKENGFRVEYATDGREALRKARTSRPDLIVLDFMLPGIEGFEVLKTLQTSTATKRIPVLVITAHPVDAESVEMISKESNVRGFLQKPFPLGKFAELIKRILARGLKT